jgi:phosphoribosylformylglycinamidine synthase subunit PurL
LTDDVPAYELEAEAPTAAASLAEPTKPGEPSRSAPGSVRARLAAANATSKPVAGPASGGAAAASATVQPTAESRSGGGALAHAPARPLAERAAGDAAQFTAEAASRGAAAEAGCGGAGRGGFDAALLELIATPNLRSKRFAFWQYDSTVQGNTVLGPGGGAAVIRVDGTRKGLALTSDCNPRFMRMDPRLGAMQAVAEAARNLACVGALPIAVTDCLNFGNPEKPGVAWQLTEAIGGLADACRALDVPVVSGNVSLYNETNAQAIPPTPTVGMVGLLEDVGLAVPAGFADGSQIVLLGEPPTSLGASEYAGDGAFPRLDLEAERRLADLLRALAAKSLLRSAQDVADGGLAIALAECALLGGTGATVFVTGVPEIMLFSEDQARAVVTCEPALVETVLGLAASRGVPAVVAGATGGQRLQIDGTLDVSLSALRGAWEAAE